MIQASRLPVYLWAVEMLWARRESKRKSSELAVAEQRQTMRRLPWQGLLEMKLKQRLESPEWPGLLERRAWKAERVFRE